MPGGDPDAWPHVKPIFQAIAAKVADGTPCCDWVGPEGAGHYVKMVHNGIEYGDMQLICEAYQLHAGRCSAWTPTRCTTSSRAGTQGALDSYLIEITRDIFGYNDPETGKPMVDLILDTAGQKGTGKWTVDLGPRPRRPADPDRRGRLRPLPVGPEGRARRRREGAQRPRADVHRRPRRRSSTTSRWPSTPARSSPTPRATP